MSNEKENSKLKNDQELSNKESQKASIGSRFASLIEDRRTNLAMLVFVSFLTVLIITLNRFFAKPIFVIIALLPIIDILPLYSKSYIISESAKFIALMFFISFCITLIATLFFGYYIYFFI